MSTQLYSLLDIVEEITKENKAPCKKTLQKIVYLVEEKNFDLGFHYVIHYYGPYSSDLDFTVQKLAWDGMLKIDIREDGHIISKNETDCNDQEHNRNDKMLDIVRQFAKETPSQLELLATTLFVERNSINKTKEKIMHGVTKIKGDKYDKNTIDHAIDILNKEKYFCIS